MKAKPRPVSMAAFSMKLVSKHVSDGFFRLARAVWPVGRPVSEAA